MAALERAAGTGDRTVIRPESMELSDYMSFVWRYRWALLVCALLGACLSYGSSLFVEDEFTASTLVLVDNQRLSSSYVKETVHSDIEGRMRTIRDQVMSRSRLTRVMEEFDLGGTGAWEDQVKGLRASIDVTTTRDEAFRISYTDTDPVRAMRMTNRLAELFIEDSSQSRDRQAQSTVSVLDSQLASLRTQLDAKERAISEFKTANMGRLPEQTSSNLAGLTRMEDQLAANRIALSAARDRELRLRQMLEQPGTAEAGVQEIARQLVARGATPDEMRMALAGQPLDVRLEVLRLQRDALLGQVTSRHPDVAMLNREIARLEERVARGDQPPVPQGGTAEPLDASTALLQDQIAAVRSEIARLERQRRSLERDIGEYQSRVEEAPRVEREHSELMRDYQSLKERYEELLAKRLDAQLSDSVDREAESPFRVVDPAVVPEVKSGPSRRTAALTGLLAGLMLALGGALARELIWQPIHTSEDIEEGLGLPVLSNVPRISHPRAEWHRVLLRGAVAVVVVGVLATVVVLHYVLRGGV